MAIDAQVLELALRRSHMPLATPALDSGMLVIALEDTPGSAAGAALKSFTATKYPLNGAGARRRSGWPTSVSAEGFQTVSALAEELR